MDGESASHTPGWESKQDPEQQDVGPLGKKNLARRTGMGSRLGRLLGRVKARPNLTMWSGSRPGERAWGVPSTDHLNEASLGRRRRVTARPPGPGLGGLFNSRMYSRGSDVAFLPL